MTQMFENSIPMKSIQIKNLVTCGFQNVSIQAKLLLLLVSLLAGRQVANQLFPKGSALPSQHPSCSLGSSFGSTLRIEYQLPGMSEVGLLVHICLTIIPN